MMNENLMIYYVHQLEWGREGGGGVIWRKAEKVRGRGQSPKARPLAPEVIYLAQNVYINGKTKIFVKSGLLRKRTAVAQGKKLNKTKFTIML